MASLWLVLYCWVFHSAVLVVVGGFSDGALDCAVCYDYLSPFLTKPRDFRRKKVQVTGLL